MDNKINNISFKANLVTSMKGRNGIMKDVAQKFAQRTKSIDGTFEIARASNNQKSLIVTLKEKKSEYIINNFADLTGENIEVKTNSSIEEIADSFVGIFRALSTKSVYEKTIKRLNKNKANAESAMRANKSSLTKALMRDKDTSKEFYLNIIEKNKAKIEKIESCINGAKERYLSILNKIAADNTRTIECVQEITK